MGSKGSTTTTSNMQLPPEFKAAYKESLGLARDAISNGYKPYTGQLVAGLTPTQQRGIANINAAQGMALPAIRQGMQLTQRGAKGITPELYNRFYSPYVKDVANATQANLLESNAQQLSGLKGGAIQAGAFGGDRSGVAAAELARQQNLAMGQTMAGIYNQGYGQAMQLAGQQAQNYGAMGQQLAGLGVGAQGSVLQGAQAQMVAGAQQQATDQARLSAMYDQWMQAQSYPYQIAQFFANIAQGLGSSAGGTSTTSVPGPSWGSQALGAVGTLGSIASMSDARAKENIKPVGELYDGQKLYRYNYKGDPETRVGLIAQEVENKNPHAVHDMGGGLKGVDYDDATRNAARMASAGGLVAPSMARNGFAEGGVSFAPYGGSRSYVPEGKIGSGGNLIPPKPDPREIKALEDNWDIKPLSADQVAGLKGMAAKLGFGKADYADDIGLGVIGSSNLPDSYGDYRGPDFSTDYSVDYSPSFARGGLARAGYADGGSEDTYILGGAPTGLLARESGGDFGAENDQGYVGRGQFGPARLLDAKRAGVIPADMTSEEFRNNKEAQKAVEAWHFADINNFIDKSGLAGYEGKEINGIPVTRDGMVSVAHLGGKTGLARFLESGGAKNPHDANGTSLSDYLSMGAPKDGGVSIVPTADTAGLAAAEKPGKKFDMSKLFASEDNPNLIEKVMGRRLSPEARAAVLNASFALMAGRSPFFFTNLGEAGKVGMNTYYAGLGNKRELAKQTADLERQAFEAKTGRLSTTNQLVPYAQALFQSIATWKADPRNNGQPLPDFFQKQLQVLEQAGLGSMASTINATPAAASSDMPAPAGTASAPAEAADAPAPGPAPVPAPDSTGVSAPAPEAAAASPGMDEGFFDQQYGRNNPQNPYFLLRRADQYARQGLFDKADADRKSAQGILDKIKETGTYIDAQGVTRNAPGVMDAKSEIKRAEGAADANQKAVGDIAASMIYQPLQGYAKSYNALNQAANVLQNFESGSLAELKANIAGMSQALGLPVDQDQLNSAADYQKFTKLMIGGLLDSGLRDKLGNVALGELELALKSTANGENQPAANRSIIGTYKGVLDWQRDRAKALKNYVQMKGGIAKVDPLDLQSVASEWDDVLGEYVNDALADTPVKGDINFSDPEARKRAKPGWKYILPDGRVGTYNGSGFEVE